MTRQISLTKSIALTVSLVLLVSGIVYVLAAAPSSTFWLAPGVYPGAPSFTVWREGSTYFAKTSYGEMSFDGTNATDVANDVFSSGITGTIKFVGTFLLDGALLPLDNQTLDLHEAVLIQTKSGIGWTDVIAIASVSNVKVYGGLLDGNKGSGVENDGINILQSTSLHGMDAPTNIIVKDVTIQNTYHDGFHITNASNCIISGNTIRNTGNTVDGYGSGVKVDGYSANNTIANNIIVNSLEHGIRDYAANSFNIFTGNQIRNVVSAGITTQGNRDIISNNILIRINGSSIYASTSNQVIDGNIIYDANPFGSNQPAIYAKNDHVISNNEIYNCYYGIEIENNCTVTGNRVYNATSYAIFVIGNYSVISSNHVSGVGSARGVRMQGAYYNTLSGGVYNQCYYGIQESSADYNIYVAQNTYTCTNGIILDGANSKCNLCWNKTTWVS